MMRTAQTYCMQLHQHQIVNQFFGQIRMLSHLECHVVIDRHIRKQRAKLEQHAHAAAQLVEACLVKLMDHLSCHSHNTRCRAQLPPNQS